MKTLVIFQDSMGVRKTSVLFDDDLVEVLQITIDYVMELKISEKGEVLRYTVLKIKRRTHLGTDKVTELIVRHITIH